MKVQQMDHLNDGISKISAAPHAVGLSADRLARISATTQAFIDDGQLAGAVTVVAKGKETIRIRLNYTGIRPEDPKVYAIYVEKAQTS